MIPHSHHRSGTLHLHSRLEAAANEQQMSGEEFGQRQDAIANFEPSLVVVVGLLAVIFLLTVLLILYFKSCHRSTAVSAENSRPSVFVSPAANANTLSGLDKKAIRSLPFFRFGALRGSKEGLECAVCLSKYEEAELLRLLPKCRHAFHVDCVDRWLSHHSTCPLCRSDVVANDSSLLARSNSIQEEAEDSISNGDNSTSISIANDVLELFVEREDEKTPDQGRVISRSSSKFSIGSSFGRLFGGEGRMPAAVCGAGAGDRVLHKHNHKIVFSDVVFKNRWSNVSSSDLIFLKSEMILSSDRFSRADSNRDQSAVRAIAETEPSQSIGAEVEIKTRISIELAKRNSNASSSSPTRALLNSGGGGSGGDSAMVEGRRSVSEITLYSRCKEVGGGGDRAEEGERKRKIWFPIARKTVEWFANGRREQTEATTSHQAALNAV